MIPLGYDITKKLSAGLKLVGPDCLGGIVWPTGAQLVEKNFSPLKHYVNNPLYTLKKIGFSTALGVTFYGLSEGVHKIGRHIFLPPKTLKDRLEDGVHKYPLTSVLLAGLAAISALHASQNDKKDLKPSEKGEK